MAQYHSKCCKVKLFSKRQKYKIHFKMSDAIILQVFWLEKIIKIFQSIYFEFLYVSCHEIFAQCIVAMPCSA